VIAVTVASMLGFAFYEIGGNLAYAIRGTTHLLGSDPLMVASAGLTLPFTAAAALATDALLRRAFGAR
jgi:hypothetical protein